MIKRIVCCALAIFFLSGNTIVTFAAPLTPEYFGGSGQVFTAQVSDNGAESAASITGYGLLVPRRVPGGGSGPSGGGSATRDGDIPSVGLTAIPDAEVPLAGAPVPSSRLPNTGAAVAFDWIWMLLLLTFIIVLIAWPKRSTPAAEAHQARSSSRRGAR